MGKRPNLQPSKDLHAKFEHVRMRRADFPAAQTYDTTLRVMTTLGGASAPQSSQALNRMINGRDPVNFQWLTLLGNVYDLPSIRAEDWYDLGEGDFIDKVDQHICHDPVDVLTNHADNAQDLDLRIHRTSLRWQHAEPPAVVKVPRTMERAMEVGEPRRAARFVHTAAVGDGLQIGGALTFPAYLEVLNIDNPDGQDPKAHVLTTFLNCAAARQPFGPFQIHLSDGGPVPIGDRYQGLSRVVVVATAAPLERRWRPESDGFVPVPVVRDFVIRLLRLPETERLVMAADYRTLPAAP
jgi:hypothetical protein